MVGNRRRFAERVSERFFGDAAFFYVYLTRVSHRFKRAIGSVESVESAPQFGASARRPAEHGTYFGDLARGAAANV